LKFSLFFSFTTCIVSVLRVKCRERDKRKNKVGERVWRKRKKGKEWQRERREKKKRNNFMFINERKKKERKRKKKTNKQTNKQWMNGWMNEWMNEKLTGMNALYDRHGVDEVTPAEDANDVRIQIRQIHCFHHFRKILKKKKNRLWHAYIGTTFFYHINR